MDLLPEILLNVLGIIANWGRWSEIQKLSEYLTTMKLDGYLFELCQKHMDKGETVEKLRHARLLSYLKVSYLSLVPKSVDK